MFARLVEKELAHHLLDFRFIAVFALCAVLSVAGVFVGVQNYRQELEEYGDAAKGYREALQKKLDEDSWDSLSREGYDWRRPPELLSPIVGGLAGSFGRKVTFRYEPSLLYQPLPHMEGSSFEANPAYAHFGVLDLQFIVMVVLSLAVLLFTHDAVCGEKEAGTLRLYASFPVSRATIALAKLVGSSLVVLVPLLFCFLLAAAALVVMPDLGLQAQDWYRLLSMLAVFGLYLIVFAAFGLWVSSLVHRRLTAFLVLMAVWTAWLYLIPNLTMRMARWLLPADSYYELERVGASTRWEIAQSALDDRVDFLTRNGLAALLQPFTDRAGNDRLDTLIVSLGELPEEQAERYRAMFRERNPKARLVHLQWDELSDRRQGGILYNYRLSPGMLEISEKWLGDYRNRMRARDTDRRNRLDEQLDLANALSAVSPASAAGAFCRDLARTGIRDQRFVEDRIFEYHGYFANYITEKEGPARRRRPDEERKVLADFVPFSLTASGGLEDCLAQNVTNVLNLLLLAALGFAGAFVSIIRYDVR